MMRFVLIWTAIALASPPARADLGTEVKCGRGTVFDPSHGCVKRNVPVAATYVAALDVLNSDPKRALGLLDTACKARYPSACTQLGIMYQSGRGRAVVKDEAKAQALFEKACDLGEVAACQRRGFYLMTMTLEPTEARVWLGKGCAKNEGLSCAELAMLINIGAGGPKDKDEALKLLDKALALMNKACPGDGGGRPQSQPAHGLACLGRGFMYSLGTGTRPDPVKALAAYLLACDARNADGCMKAAQQYDEQHRAAEAQTIYEKACLYDSARGCSTAARRGANADHKAVRPLELANRACELDTRECEILAVLYDHAYAGLPKPDRERATALFKSLCDAGDQSGCVRFARRARAGTGMPADPALADKILDSACTAKEAEACGELATRYAQVRTDDAKGYRFAQTGCKLGSKEACTIVGWMIANNRRGAAVQSNEAAAKEALPFYDTACEYSSEIGCHEAAKLRAAGNGTPRDIAQAARMYSKACEDLYPPYAAACVALGELYNKGSAELTKDVDQAVRLVARACALDHEGACSWLPGNAKAPVQIKEVTAKLGPACETGEHDRACFALGQLLMSRGTSDEKHAGYDVTVKACGRKHAPSCHAQLIALFHGIGTLEDKAKAELLAKQYCDAGDGEGCVFASQLYREARTGERRLKYADLACTLKAASGCNEAGFMYYTSAQGTRWNITAAADYYVKACALGSAIGCANQAELARHGILGAADPNKAAELYKKSCELNAWAGCAGWAHYLVRGEAGQSKDVKKATELFRGACDADIDSACVELADLLEHDQASASEIARIRLKAFELTRKQAESNPGYMYWLGIYFRDGMATMKDDKKALEWFSKACDGFDPLGCVAAGKALSASPNAKDHEQAKAYYTRACAAGVEDGCAALKLPNPGSDPANPAKLQARGCGCGGEVAPGGRAGLAVVLLAFGWLTRAGACPWRRSRRSCDSPSDRRRTRAGSAGSR